MCSLVRAEVGIEKPVAERLRVSGNLWTRIGWREFSRFLGADRKELLWHNGQPVDWFLDTWMATLPETPKGGHIQTITAKSKRRSHNQSSCATRCARRPLGRNASGWAVTSLRGVGTGHTQPFAADHHPSIGPALMIVKRLSVSSVPLPSKPPVAMAALPNTVTFTPV